MGHHHHRDDRKKRSSSSSSSSDDDDRKRSSSSRKKESSSHHRSSSSSSSKHHHSSSRSRQSDVDRGSSSKRHRSHSRSRSPRRDKSRDRRDHYDDRSSSSKKREEGSRSKDNKHEKSSSNASAAAAAKSAEDLKAEEDAKQAMLQQSQIELEQQRRREAARLWQEQKRKLEEAQAIAEGKNIESVIGNASAQTGDNPQADSSQQQGGEGPKKHWSLEDDDDIEEDIEQPMDMDDDGMADMEEDDDDAYFHPPPLKPKVNEEEDKLAALAALHHHHHHGDSNNHNSSGTTTTTTTTTTTAAASTTATATTTTNSNKITTSNNNNHHHDNNNSNSSKKKAADDDEVDPLDAFMAGVQTEVKKLDSGEVKRSSMLNDRTAEGSDEEEDDEENQEEEKEFDLQEWLDKKKNVKILKPVDHSLIEYPPFRKKFYIEVPDIARMTKEEVKDYLEELDGIKIRGKDCPKPIKTWTQCGLSDRILSVIKKAEWDKPSPIQCQALPVIMSGRDCIGVAKTGSGKTAAYLLPLFRHAMDQPRVVSGEGPIGIIFAPARELCIQIFLEAKRFLKHTGVTGAAIYGGAPVADQIAELKKGVDLIVCTPGRMIDMLCANAGRVLNLRRVTYLVIDEADRMFDMGFEPQISRIIDNCRPDKQLVMLSATFPSQMEALAKRVLNNPVEIIIGGRSVVSNTIEHFVEVRTEESKFLRLLELLGIWYEKGSTLVFVDRQEDADDLLGKLLRHGYPCLSLHGGKDQSDRDSTLADFKNQIATVMVATSVAARGLDVKHLRLVVNYDCPSHYEDYVHRVGRTGRAGREGTAYTFITESEAHHAGDMIKALELSSREVSAALRQLANSFEERRKAGLVRGVGSGFGGKGFKFNETEAEKFNSERNKEKKKARIEMGLDMSDDDDDEAAFNENDTNTADTPLLLQQQQQQQMQQQLQQQQQQIVLPNIMPPSSLPSPMTAATTTNTNASLIPTLPPFGAPGSTIFRPPPVPIFGAVPSNPAVPGLLSTPSIDPNIAAIRQSPQLQAAAAAAAAAIGLGGSSVNQPYLPPQVPTNPAAAAAAAAAAMAALAASGGQVPTKHFVEEIEINDYPQQARYKVTHRDSLGPICEFTGCAITTRGIFVPQGKQAPPGERKLYLVVEGKTPEMVKRAKIDVKKVLEEATIEATNREQNKLFSRYTI